MVWRGAGGAPVSGTQGQATRPGTVRQPNWDQLLQSGCCWALGAGIHCRRRRQAIRVSTSIQPASLSSPNFLPSLWPPVLPRIRHTHDDPDFISFIVFRILPLAHLDPRAGACPCILSLRFPCFCPSPSPLRRLSHPSPTHHTPVTPAPPSDQPTQAYRRPPSSYAASSPLRSPTPPPPA